LRLLRIPLLTLCAFFGLTPAIAAKEIRIVTTSTDLGALARDVGGPYVQVETLAKGSQNLHYLEAKPSFMVHIRNADLVVANGLGLEEAWLPHVLRGARNPKVNAGGPGYLELGSHIEAIEVPEGQVTRSHGDIHPQGNPHWTLDPERMAKAALTLGAKLKELAPEHGQEFADRAKRFHDHLLISVNKWQERISQAGVQKVITHHRTLNYFLSRFGIEPADYLEPKPGIPPSAQHILSVIKSATENKIRLILVEHYYDPKVAQRVAKDVPRAKVMPVVTAVGGSASVPSLESLYEQIVQILEESN
jgi:zinc/manganese transport system substrate-binding protein